MADIPGHNGVYNKLPVSVGSFWYENVANRNDVLTLIQAASRETEWLDVWSTARAWGQRDRTTIVRNHTVSLRDRHVLYFGVDRQKRIVTSIGEGETVKVFSVPDAETLASVHGIIGQTEDTDHVFGDEDNRLMFFPESGSSGGGILLNSANLQPRYLLHLERDLEPAAIASNGGTLVNGIDFHRAGEWLVFHEPVEKLFPDEKMHVLTGYLRRPDLYGYLEGTDGSSADMERLPIYSKKAGGIKNFARAALSVAGFPMLREPSRLLSVLNLNWPNKRYVYDKEVVETRYPHIPDETGKEYPEAHIPGSVARIFSRRHQGGAWWRSVDWSEGLPLMGGLVAPTDASTAFEPVAEVNGKFHIRNVTPGRLGGTAQEEDEFWTAVHAAEERTGLWLNDLQDEQGNPYFGFSNISDSPVITNFVDIIMSHWLGNRVIVFEVRGVAITEHDKVRFERYVREERPADALPIIFYRYPDEPL